MLAFINVRRRPAGSKAEIEIKIATIWWLRDGKIVRGRGIANRERALAVFRD